MPMTTQLPSRHNKPEESEVVESSDASELSEVAEAVESEATPEPQRPLSLLERARALLATKGQEHQEDDSRQREFAYSEMIQIAIRESKLETLESDPGKLVELLDDMEMTIEDYQEIVELLPAMRSRMQSVADGIANAGMAMLRAAELRKAKQTADVLVRNAKLAHAIADGVDYAAVDSRRELERLQRTYPGLFKDGKPLQDIWRIPVANQSTAPKGKICTVCGAEHFQEGKVCGVTCSEIVEQIERGQQLQAEFRKSRSAS